MSIHPHTLKPSTAHQNRSAIVVSVKAACAGAAATLAVLLGGGCSFHAPAVELASSSVGQTTPSGSVIDVQLSIISKSDQPIPLRNIEYTVEVDGMGEAGKFSGVRAAESTLRGGGTHALVVPAAFASGAPIPAGTPYRISGDLYYLEPGQIAAILYDYHLLRPSVSFSGSGTIGQSPATPATPDAPKK